MIAEEGLINRLEKIREYSKKALATNDLRAALEGYKVAADIAEKFPRSLRDEKAILYSNMAAVHLKKDEPKEALEAVEKSLRNDAGYVKVNAQEKRSARAHFSRDLSLKSGIQCFQSSAFLLISAVSSFSQREREKGGKNAYKITLTEPQREMRKNCSQKISLTEPQVCEPLNCERHGQCTLSFC